MDQKKQCREKMMTWILLGMGMSFFLGAGALSYWKQSGNSMNILHTGVFRNQIVEKYTVPEDVNPGDSVEKIVNVSNTGDVDSLIRLSVEKVFGETGEDDRFIVQEDLAPDVIHIAFDTTWWVFKDGYYYYKDILKAGDTTREPLFRQYAFSEKAGNEYKGKEARIIVNMEAIQADADLIKYWGVTAGEIGIVQDTGNRYEERKDMKIVYQGKEGGFMISERTTDLFASFVRLTPGCGRSQRVSIENHSSDTVELLLRAEAVEQFAESAGKREALEELLNLDAVIRITDGERELYCGPISGKVRNGKKSMTEDISLGTFPAGKKKELLVMLRMNPDMDIQKSGLAARVRWVFTAKGDDTRTVTTQYLPETGDNTLWWFWLFCLLGCGHILYKIWKNSGRMEKTL